MTGSKVTLSSGMLVSEFDAQGTLEESIGHAVDCPCVDVPGGGACARQEHKSAMGVCLTKFL